MAKVNPIMIKFCVDFTSAKTPPHLLATKKAKVHPLNAKYCKDFTFAIFPITYKGMRKVKVSISYLIFSLVSHLSLYLKGTKIAKVKSELENFT